MHFLSLNKLKLWQKFLVLVMAMSLPATAVGLFYLHSTSERIDQARAELDGSHYLRAISNFTVSVIRHENRSFLLASGDVGSRPAVKTAAQRANAALAHLAKVNAKLGKRYGVRQKLQAVQTNWKAVRAGSTQFTSTELTAAHRRLLGQLDQLRDDVATASRATSDPNQESRALLDIATRYVPAAMADESALRRYAVNAAANGKVSGADRMGIQIARSRLNADFASIGDGIAELPASSRVHFVLAMRSALIQRIEFYQTVAQQVLNAHKVKISAATLYADGSSVDKALMSLLSVSGKAASKALATRVSALSRARIVDLSFVLLAIVLIHVLTWSIEHGLTSPLRRVVEVFERISAGRYDSTIDVRRHDEFGQVLSALASMQEKLHTQLQDERRAAAENGRIRQALDKTSTGVLLADAEHKIVYLNEAASASFTRNAADFRRVLPEFDGDKLHGETLESLSVSPNDERSALDALNNARSEDRNYGNVSFRVTTSPVIDAHGNRLGTVMEWKERTQEVRVEEEMQGVLSAVTADDLTRRITLNDKTGFFAKLGAGVNRLADNLAEIVSRVKSTTREISVGADEITKGNSNLSSRTEEQASSLEETASSMEEMTTTVKQNADNAAQASQLALAARDQAEQGVGVVDNAVTAMAGIDQSAQKIADIIGVIDEIAFQTNLLALNAAVEAARAGEQGRGFAVVASEVRNLAGRSATAAKEIKSLIEDSVSKVGDGSQLVTQSGQALGEIVLSVKKVSDIVAEIAAASREQSAGIEQVNRAVMQMDQITQQNAALVEETIGASQVMSGQVRGLSEILAPFRLTGSAAGSEPATPAGTTASPANTSSAVAVGDGR